MCLFPFPRAAGRAVFLVALGAGPVAAADKPATPEQAASLQAFFLGVLPKPAAGDPPLVTVKADGAAYVVSFDLRAANGLPKASGGAVTFDPALIVYKLFDQDDGKWRIVMDSLPKIVAHSGATTSTVEFQNLSQTLVVDPAIAWWTGGSASSDGGLMTATAPDARQSIHFGPVKVDYTTTPGAAGAVSSTARETISDIAVKVAAASQDHAPVDLDGRFDSAAFDFGFEGLRTRKVFDAWTLVSANRGNLGPHADALKGLLREIAAPGLKFLEGATLSKATFSSPYGAIALGGAKIATGFDNAGKDSAVRLAISAEGLSLPVGLAPPGAADLTPSKIDLAATLKGIDVSAAASTAIDRLRIGGDGPALTDDDMAGVAQALLSAGPLKVELAPSRVVAPAIDADLAGSVTYDGVHPSGALTVRMRNFDKTMAAVNKLGPDIARKALPGLAMAKGLAKSETDGALSWVVELGQDRSISVNGIPLGRAPE